MKIKSLILSFVCICSFSYAQQGFTSPTLNDQFKKKIGGLRFSESTISLGKVFNNEVKNDTVYFYNVSKTAISISGSAKLPAHLKLTIGTTSVAPDSKGWLLISYDATKKNDYGFVFDRIQLTTNDIELPMKTINITASIQEYFPPAAIGDTTIAKAGFSETTYDFGTIKQGEKVSKSLTVTNSGTKKLIIRSIKSSCGCLKYVMSKMEIMPGESATLKVDYDSFGKDGKDTRSMSVFVNDPSMPEVKIVVSGTVVK